MSSPRTPLTAVVVGAGAGGTLSINALQASDRYELVGVADLAPSSLARFASEAPTVATSTDYQALFEQLRPDVVCVSTYPPSHSEITRAAIAAGAKGLLVEKPLGHDTEAGRDIISMARDAGIPMVVPHGLMAQAAPLDIVRRVRGGEIGRLVLVEIESAEWDIVNAGIHWIQFFIALTSPDAVSTVLTAADTSSRTYRDGMQVETDSITVATTETGVRLMLQTGDYMPIARPDTICVMRLIGTEGFIEYGAWDRHFTLLAAGPGKREVEPPDLPVSGHQFHLEHLAHLVDTDTLDTAIPLASLHALEVVDAAYHSARTRSRVTLPLTAEAALATETAPSANGWDPGRPYSGVGGGRNGRAL